jgi:hypothetical protein
MKIIDQSATAPRCRVYADDGSYKAMDATAALWLGERDSRRDIARARALSALAVVLAVASLVWNLAS